MSTYNYTSSFFLHTPELVTTQQGDIGHIQRLRKQSEIERQEEGFSIARDNSPSAVAKKQLNALG